MVTSLRTTLGPSYDTIQGGSRAERLAALKNLDADDARKVLVSIADGLGSRKGVLRLLHVGSDAKDMRFTDASKLKSLFLRGSKLTDAGEVVAALMQKAGMRNHEAFADYARARGKWGVEKKALLGYLRPVLVRTGDSKEQALENAGAQYKIAKDGSFAPYIGKGGQGEVYAGTFEGKPCAIKDFDPPPPVSLAELNGTPIKPAPQKFIRRSEGERSFVTFDDDTSDHEKSILSKTLPHKPKAHNSYMQPSEQLAGPYSHAGSKQSFVSGAEENPNPAELSGKAGPTAVLAPDKQPMVGQQPIEPGVSGIDQIISEQEISGEKSEGPLPGPDKSDLSLPSPAPHKLGRSAATQAVNVKDNPYVIAPTLYVIKEKKSNGDNTFHAVHALDLKRWARTQDRGSEFSLASTVMPVADGKTLGHANVSRDQLPAVSADFLKALQQLARQGFIHGDLKEDNAFMGKNGLRIVDDIGQKVSKRVNSPNGSIPTNRGAATPGYMHPFISANIACGVGRDLFAAGVTLLRLGLSTDPALKSTKESWDHTLLEKFSNAQAALQLADDLEQAFGAEPAQGEANPHLRFAARCMIEAIRYENARREQGINNQFERWTAGEPNHILNKLASDPFVSGLMSS